jgi:hypothetical protein
MGETLSDPMHRGQCNRNESEDGTYESLRDRSIGTVGRVWDRRNREVSNASGPMPSGGWNATNPG